MKRQLLTYAITAVIALGTIVACSKKDSNPEKLSLNSAQMNGPDDPASIADCYRNFVNTLKNPPADYIPGDAENAFTECANSFVNFGGGGRKLYPPAPPVPTGQIDPYFTDPSTVPDPYINGEKIMCDFFGKPYPLMILTPPLPPDYFFIRGKINRYNSIINSIVSNNPLLPTARDKINACITHVVNWSDQYIGLNKEEFFRYLSNVVYKHNTKLTIRSQFADMLEINDNNFKSLFIEQTGSIYP